MKQKSITLNAVINGLRQSCSVLFPLITTRYVTWILGKENYGKVNFGNSVVSYFVLFAALGISSYAIREGARIRDQKLRFQQLCNEVFTINILSTLLSYGVLFLLLMFWSRIQNYRILILIQSSIIIFTTLGTDWVNNIFEDYFYTTVRYIICQVLGLVCMFCFVRSAQDYLIYAGITALVNIGGNVINIAYIRKKYICISLTKHPNFHRHLPPMLFLFGNTMASTIYVNSDITLLTLIKGDAATGIYSISVKVYTIVKQFINAVIGVALPRLSAYLGKGDKKAYNHLLNKVLYVVVMVILPCMVGLFMLSSQIICILAGEEYISGTVSLKILSVALGLAVLSFFFVYSAMIPNGLEKYSLLATCTSAVINVGLNLFMIPLLSLNGAAITTVISEAVVLGMSIYYSAGKIKIDLKFKQFLPGIAGCLGICGTCLAVQQLLSDSILIVIFAVFTSVLVYTVALFVLRETVITQMIKKTLARFRKRKS